VASGASSIAAAAVSALVFRLSTKATAASASWAALAASGAVFLQETALCPFQPQLPKPM